MQNEDLKLPTVVTDTSMILEAFQLRGYKQFFNVFFHEDIFDVMTTHHVRIGIAKLNFNKLDI